MGATHRGIRFEHSTFTCDTCRKRDEIIGEHKFEDVPDGWFYVNAPYFTERCAYYFCSVACLKAKEFEGV